MADHPEMSELQSAELDQRRAERIAREREMLKVGLGQLDRGEHYDWDVVKAWMKRLETDPDAKLPARSDAGISRRLR